MTLHKTPFNILLVENSRTTRLALTHKLTEQGYQVESTSHGQTALTLLSEQPFDLIILDIFMPQMNGYEVAQQIRASNSQFANIPIFALSASEDEKVKQRALTAGINSFILKTHDQNPLLTSIQKLRQSLET